MTRLTKRFKVVEVQRDRRVFVVLFREPNLMMNDTRRLIDTASLAPFAPVIDALKVLLTA
jgi:hypothetical protein